MPSLRLPRAAALLAPLLALALSACQGGSGNGDPAVAAGDRALGASDAPVTIIEYASVTCTHCRTFHEGTFKELKEKYIDTGDVRFIFRELPTPPVRMAMAGFLVARCVAPDAYFDMIDLQFRQQRTIFERAQSEFETNPNVIIDIYRDIARSAGLTDEAFDACVRDEAEIERIRALVADAEATYGVTSTPSFVINGIYRDTLAQEAGEPFEITIEDFDAVLGPLLEAE